MEVRDLVADLFGEDMVSTCSVPMAEEYLILQGRGSTVLVPRHPRTARIGGLPHSPDGSPLFERSLRKLLSVALRSNWMSSLVGSRTWITTEPGSSLHSHFARCLGHVVVVSATFGPVRPNQKPVLRICDEAGRLVAYGKVGWNDLTKQLVANEASVLRTLANHRSSIIRWSEVIDYSSWENLDLLIIKPLRGGGRKSQAVSPALAIREIVALQEVSVGPLTSLPFWEFVSKSIPDVLRQRLAERSHATELRCGYSHGDWTPWNMAYAERKLNVWDWERASGGVPLGLDALHFEFQSRLRRGGRLGASLLAALHALTSDGYELATPDMGVMAGLYAAWMAERFDAADQPPAWLSTLVTLASELGDERGW